jgi:hypothetical protein
VCVEVAELLTLQPVIVSQSEDTDVPVVCAVFVLDVIKYDVVAEQIEAVSVWQLVGSDEYVSSPSRPMVISGHGGSEPLTVKPSGQLIEGGGPGG